MSDVVPKGRVHYKFGQVRSSVQTFCKHERNEPFPDTLNDEGVEVWSELVDDVFCFIFQYGGQVW